MRPNLPYLTYSDVGERAQSFLSQYHPSLELPIPIEKIVDVDMGLNVFPYPRLYKDFGINGFLSRDRTTINVDEFQYDHLHEKFRFTLTHELGHYILHRSIYENLTFETPDEYIAWSLSIPPEEMSWFETHGDWFAEQVLVPTSRLEEICIRVVEKHQDKLSKLTKIPEDFWSYASNEIAKDFEVNPPPVAIRIAREKLSQKIPVLKST